MAIKFRRVKKDDSHFGYKAGDIVVVETNNDWDSDKCVCGCANFKSATTIHFTMNNSNQLML